MEFKCVSAEMACDNFHRFSPIFTCDFLFLLFIQIYVGYKNCIIARVSQETISLDHNRHFRDVNNYCDYFEWKFGTNFPICVHLFRWPRSKYCGKFMSAAQEKKRNKCFAMRTYHIYLIRYIVATIQENWKERRDFGDFLATCRIYAHTYTWNTLLFVLMYSNRFIPSPISRRFTTFVNFITPSSLNRAWGGNVHEPKVAEAQSRREWKKSEHRKGDSMHIRYKDNRIRYEYIIWCIFVKYAVRFLSFMAVSLARRSNENDSGFRVHKFCLLSYIP